MKHHSSHEWEPEHVQVREESSQSVMFLQNLPSLHMTCFPEWSIASSQTLKREKSGVQHKIIFIYMENSQACYHLFQVVIKPMMYIALTYDHRLIDGREAVTFLRKIKQAVEDPRIMLCGL